MKIRGAVLERIGDERPYAASRPLTISELELGEPDPNEVLVQIEAAGICHSDLSVVDGIRPRPMPMLLGHEAAGIVVEAGPLVTDIAPGTRVVMTFLPRCERCDGCATGGVRPCIEGTRANENGTLMDGAIRLSRGAEPVHHHLGVSGFATHAIVHRRSIVAVDDDIPPDVAALLGCAVLTGGGAVLNCGRPRPGQRLAVVGLGGVGMSALLAALSVDGVEVIGIDASESKCNVAAALGAHRTYVAAEAAGVRADIVIEAAGNVRAFELAVGITDAGGSTITVGLPAPEARAAISPLALVAGGRSIVGSYLGSAVPSRDIPTFADRWRRGLLPVEKLVSHTIRLDEINEAMDRLAEGTALRQLITM